MVHLSVAGAKLWHGALADVAIQKDLVVMADEIYERLVYGANNFASFATVRPGLQERTILINGVSKTYALTSPAPIKVEAPVGSIAK